METRKEALEELAEVLAKHIVKVIDNNIRSCIMCINFKEETELCEIYKARPPARVIAKGCEQFLDDVPF